MTPQHEATHGGFPEAGPIRKTAMRMIVTLVAFGLLVFLADRWQYRLDWVESEYRVNTQTNWLATEHAVGACVPPFATDIHVAADLDTNEHFAAFRFLPEKLSWFPRGGAGSAAEPLRAYSWSFARSRSWWDENLVESALAGTGPDVRGCDVYGSAFVVVDEKTGRGFAWWSGPFDL